MPNFIYKCTTCGKTYKRDEVRYLCPECSVNYKPGMPLLGVLMAEFDYDFIKSKFSKENPDMELFSCVEKKYFCNFPVGNTPFGKAERLGDELGFSNIAIKNDTLNPSGSLKDRASFWISAEAKRLGLNTIVTASTGNAACALSAVCAAAGQNAIIFAPAKAPKAKLVQILLYGANLIPVNGTYDDAFKLSLEYSKLYDGLNRNTGYHPLTIEGKKTVGLEIWQQNGCKEPDAIIIPTGDGVILGGVYKAFYDLKMAGLINKIPKLICVQAETSNAIHKYFTSGTYSNISDVTTLADSISVSIPSAAHLAKEAIEKSGGFSILVSDEEILEGQKLLARSTGIFAEPSSSTTVAGLKKLKNDSRIDSSEQIVLLVTGNGLKDIDNAMKGVEIPSPVETSIDAVVERLKK